MADPSLALSPWWSPEQGWTVGRLPVEWFGLAVEAERTRLPQRWTSLDSAGEDVEPSDLELAWVVHALEHEVARATGAELELLVECWGIDLPVPAGAVHAAEQGQTLVPWCSGPSWHWHSETVAGPFIDRRRSRMDLTYSGECRVRRRSGVSPIGTSGMGGERDDRAARATAMV